MGGGRWSASTYDSTTATKMASGTSFAYSAATAAAAPSARKAHDMLDPKRVNNAGAHEGKNIRESLDTDEHPLTTTISIGLDVTGSNIDNALVVQKKLPTLMGLLTRGGIVEHPAISIAGIGDAQCGDRVPLQFSPFEHDNRIDEWLDSVYLEGGGGGNFGESYGLYLYFLANNTYLDSVEKRGKKGYAFMIADERTLPLTPGDVNQFIGDGKMQESFDLKSLIEAAQKNWDLFILSTNNNYQGSYDIYRGILGERCVALDNADTVSEVIAGLVRGLEGDDADDIDNDLATLGATSTVREAVGKALVSVGAGSGGSLATSEAPGGLDLTDDDTTTRI